MSVEHSVWIGMLDVDGDRPIGAIGPPLSSHRRARLLVRKHLAPIGYVDVPVAPAESLPRRAHEAAEQTLNGALQAHQHCRPAELPTGVAVDGCVPPGCTLAPYATRGPGVSIVVCTRDRPNELETCLTAMQRLTYEPLEILVVDNAPSTDATR